MAKYMTQIMRSGTQTQITYYKKQSAHPSHTETGAFTQAAITAYAAARNVLPANVEKGKFQSDQGVPTGGVCEEL